MAPEGGAGPSGLRGGAPDRISQSTRSLFNDTAQAYDRFNHIFSLGWGAWYRRRCLRRAGLRPGMRVLDVAVGTGLVAREAVRLTAEPRNVVGVDISEGMLDRARPLGIQLVQGAAEALPIATGSVDFLTLGYALRHIADPAPVLAEFERVLHPDGTLLLIELRRPRHALTRALIAQHFRRIVPLLCTERAHRDRIRTLMEYHWETVERNPAPDAIGRTLAAAGFADIRVEIYFDLFCSFTARRIAHGRTAR